MKESTAMSWINNTSGIKRAITYSGLCSVIVWLSIAVVYAETFNQSNWGGGSSASTASGVSNQTGWINYASSNGNVNVVNVGGDLEIARVPDSVTHSSYTDFTNNPSDYEFRHSTTAQFELNSIKNNTTVGIGQVLLAPTNNLYSWASAPDFDGPSYGSSSAVTVTLADLDNDGDLDLLRGVVFGYVHAYENTGTIDNPVWTSVGWGFNSSQGSYPSPTLADLDGDGDLDMLLGVSTRVRAYRNIGDKTAPVWSEETDWSIDGLVGSFVRPTLADLDNDGDKDLLVGQYGVIKAYINMGDANAPVWVAQTDWDMVTASNYPSPSLADMDGDGDFDVAYSIGSVLRGFENTGTVSLPVWAATTAWDSGVLGNPNLGIHVVDFDGDADLDVMVGTNTGKVTAWANTATEYEASGSFESGLIDVGVHSGYSSLSFRADVPADTTLSVEFRAGDTSSPDGSWTGWQLKPVDGDISLLLGNQRYFQYRLNFNNVSAPATVTPKVFQIDLTTSDYPNMDNIAVGEAGITLDRDFLLNLRGAYPGGNMATAHVKGSYVYSAYSTGNSSSRSYVIDVSDPDSPTYVAQTSHGSRVYDAYVDGDYLYVAATSNGIDIFDITTPTSPSFLRRVNTPSWAQRIFIEGDYGYVADWRNGGLQIFDNTVPASASLVVPGYITPGDAVDVYVAGNYAYIADNPQGLVIVDISDKTSPQYVGSYGLAINGVRVRGKYAYVLSPNFGFRILDISDPSKIEFISSVPEITSQGRGIHLDGSYAYVTAASNVYVVDIRDPRYPSVVTSVALTNAGDIDSQGNYAYIATGANMQVLSLGGFDIATSGNFQSSIIDIGPNTGLTSLDFISNVPVNTSLSVSVRSGPTPTPEDGGWSSWLTVSNSGDDISSLGANRYVQYKLDLGSTDTAVSPTVSRVTLNFERYAFEAKIISSAFDSLYANNLLDAFSWTESLSANTDLRVQLRSAQDNAGVPGAWSDWLGPDGTSASFWDSSNTHGGECSGSSTINCLAVPDVFRDGLSDQWIQYQVTMSSLGDNTPTLHDITLAYFAGTTSGINVSVSTVTTSESSLTPVNFTIALTGPPASDVKLSLYSTDLSEGVVAPATLIFTPADWAAKTVVITPIDDAMTDGDVNYSVVITASESADTNYHNINPPDISVTHLDDEVVGVEVTPTSGLFTSEDNSLSATFDVRLLSEPTQPVTIPVSSDNSLEGVTSVSELVFDDSNWNIFQTVTVTGVIDGVIDGDASYNVSLDTVITTDPAYANYNPVDVSLLNYDIDVADIIVAPAGVLTTSENFRIAPFTISLASRPTTTVRVLLTSSNLYEGVVLPSSLTFTPANWNIPQTVSVSGKDDSVVDGDVAYQVQTSFLAFGEANYTGITPDNIDVVNLDNDGYVISVIAPDYGVITTEGGEGNFAVKLGTQPTSPVTLTFSSTDLTEGIVDQSITFLPTDDVTNPKTVTIQALDDEYFDGDQRYSIVISDAVSDDSNFNGISVNDISVINKENNYITTIIDSDKSRLRTSFLDSPVMFGASVAAGDFDNDGFNDIAVGEYISNSSTSGAVYVYFGSAQGYSKTNMTSIYSDLSGRRFGEKVATGDFNNDGYDDLVVGNRSFRPTGSYTGEGRVQVYFGGESGLESSPSWSFLGVPGSFTGDSVAAEDLNGDGADEIIVSTYLEDANGFVNSGRVYIFNGVPPGGYPSTVPTTVITGTQDEHRFGTVVAPGGDVDGDGYNDLLVGAHYRPNTSTHTGTVYVYSGSASGVNTSPSWVVSMANLNNRFGRYLSSAGDVNGDGIDDILVGATGYGSFSNYTEERAMVFYGRSAFEGGPSTTPDWLMQTPYTYGTGFGSTLAAIGDVNNDGFADILVGASTYESSQGRAHIYYGSSAGPSMKPDWVETSGQPYGSAAGPTNYSASAVSLGDINGDGNGDFVVGAYSFDNGQMDEGAVLIYTSVAQTIPRTATVFPISGHVTSEWGEGTSFTVVLDHPPTSDVLIPLSSSEPSEGMVSPSSLTFTPLNWHIPQTVTVVGVDDSIDDGDVSYVIRLEASVSGDGRYNALDFDDVPITNLNDDRTVSITASDAVAGEYNLDKGEYTVSLNQSSSQTLLVTYSISGSAVPGVDYDALGGSITIPAGSLSASFQISPVDDQLVEGNENVVVTLTAGAYYEVGASSSAEVIIGDDDSAGIIVSPSLGLTTTEAGGASQFSVVLTSQPSDDVTISVSSSDLTEGVPVVSRLIFTPTDWSIAKTVTVAGVDDDVDDGDIAYSITLANPVSLDLSYSALSSIDVPLSNRDDDAFSNANISVLAVNSSLSEGSTTPGIFKLVRTGSLSNSLTIGLSFSGSAGNGIDYFASSTSSVTLLAGDESVNVLITPRDDSSQEANEAIVLSLSPGSGYIIEQPGAATIILEDDDLPEQPSVSFLLDQVVEEGSGFSLTAVLDRTPLAYPVSIPFTVTGDAIYGSDHNAVDGIISIASGLTGSVSFTTVNDGPNEADEVVIFTMGVPVNAVLGGRTQHSVTITEENVAPTVSLLAEQNAVNTRLIVTNEGEVTLTASVEDANPGDTHSYAWGLTNNALVDTNLDADPATFVFDPSGLVPGFYGVVLTVTDGNGGTATIEILLEVVAAAPVLSAADSDGDGIADDIESYGDSDGDGIANYKDSDQLAAHELQSREGDSENYIIRTDVGLSLQLGVVAFASQADGADVTIDEIASYGGGEASAGVDPNDGIANVGGYFDYEIWGLSQAGQSARLVLPQFNPIPQGAVYRKYFGDTGWSVFVENERNAIASAPGLPGICPSPGDSTYRPGLNEGDHCIQLTIEDGGPNDTDRIRNYVIADPGTLSVTNNNVADQGNERSDSNPRTTQGGGGLTLLLPLLMICLLIRNSRRTRCVGQCKHCVTWW